MKAYYVYILKCIDDSYYTGITNDVDRRLSEHQEGIDKMCYTYKRRPLELVFHEIFNDVNQAVDFEKQVNGWSRKKKEALVKDNWEELKRLSECRNDSHHRSFSDGYEDKDKNG